MFVIPTQSESHWKAKCFVGHVIADYKCPSSSFSCRSRTESSRNNSVSEHLSDTIMKSSTTSPLCHPFFLLSSRHNIQWTVVDTLARHWNKAVRTAVPNWHCLERCHSVTPQLGSETSPLSACLKTCLRVSSWSANIPVVAGQLLALPPLCLFGTFSFCRKIIPVLLCHWSKRDSTGHYVREIEHLKMLRRPGGVDSA